jgi:hypothetical protein
MLSEHHAAIFVKVSTQLCRSLLRSLPLMASVTGKNEINYLCVNKK